MEPMDNKKNLVISVSYQLYDVTDGQNELLEQTTDDRPFSFISGLGIALDAFEKQIVAHGQGENFDFTLTPAEAYGDYVDERVIDLDKSIFTIDGHFDDKHVYPDAIIPLQNENGQRFNGQVVEVTTDKVKIDLNHPLAGRTLNFRGQVIENREASNDELAAYVQQLQGGCGGCGGGCDDCESGCGHHEGKHHGDGHCGHHGEGHGDGHCGHHGDGGCCHQEK